MFSISHVTATATTLRSIRGRLAHDSKKWSSHAYTNQPQATHQRESWAKNTQQDDKRSLSFSSFPLSSNINASFSNLTKSFYKETVLRSQTQSPQFWSSAKTPWSSSSVMRGLTIDIRRLKTCWPSSRSLEVVPWTPHSQVISPLHEAAKSWKLFQCCSRTCFNKPVF